MTAVVHGFAPAAMMHMHGCAQVGRWVRQALLDHPTRRLRQPSFDPRGGLAGLRTRRCCRSTAGATDASVRVGARCERHRGRQAGCGVR